HGQQRQQSSRRSRRRRHHGRRRRQRHLFRRRCRRHGDREPGRGHRRRVLDGSPANVETLVLQGAGTLDGTGNGLANSIYGNSGDNLIDGGGGADMLTGNGGNDTFAFNVGQADSDAIADFAGNGAAAGDSLQFVGYGAGATFTNIDATRWQVNYNGGTQHE